MYNKIPQRFLKPLGSNTLLAMQSKKQDDL